MKSSWWQQGQRRLKPALGRGSLVDILLTVAALVIGILTGYEHQLLSPTTLPDQKMTWPSSTTGKLPAPSAPLEILGELAKERTKLDKKLQNEYAEYTGLLFNRIVNDDLFTMDDDSRKRLSRRIMRKIVQAADRSKHRYGDDDVTFTWVTAGDSSAGGYGNLDDQSYTSILEDTLKEPFAALGITFVAKNRAVGGDLSAAGGSGSVTELALCLESMYGLDIDVLSWDISSSSLATGPDHSTGGGRGGRDVRMNTDLWVNRAAAHPARPILFLMLEDRSSDRWDQFHRFGTKGIGVGLMSKSAYSSLKRSRIPDTNDRRRIENGDILPPALRYFLCNGATEGVTTCKDEHHDDVRICPDKDGLICREHKWDTQRQCDSIGNKYQVNWHPGWKEHLLIGRLLGSFLFQALSEAAFDLKTLVSSMSTRGATMAIKGQVAKKITDIFDQDDDRDTFLFETTRIDIFEQGWGSLFDGDNDRGNLRQKLFRSRAICRTSLLPSEIYADGLLDRYASQHRNGTYSPLTLTSVQLNEGNCPAAVTDYRNVFLIGNEEKEVRTHIPDELEEEYFRSTEPAGEHLIILCFQICVDNMCARSRQGFHGTDQDQIEISIDEEIVNRSVEMESCHILKSNNKSLWKTLSGHGYSLTFHLNEPNSFIEITSIIII